MNVITGSSDSGKSAIIRALMWALKNRPSGESFKTWGTGPKDTVEVALEFDNDWFIKDRVGGKNRYKTEDGNYEALRSDVPEPINQISNMVEYNIQTQFQPYFMLQDSPGERAKKLNDHVGLSIVDAIYKKLNGKISAIDMWEGQLEELSYIDAVDVLVSNLSNDIDRYTKDSGTVSQLTVQLNKIADIDEQISKHNKILKAEDTYKALELKLVQLANNQEMLGFLAKDLNNIKCISENIIADKEWLEVDSHYQTIMDKIKQVSVEKVGSGQLESLVVSVKRMTTDILHQTSVLNGLIKTYADDLLKLGYCPTCMSIVDKEVSEDIIRELSEA
jgi:exonuclease SbcC